MFTLCLQFACEPDVAGWLQMLARRTLAFNLWPVRHRTCAFSLLSGPPLIDSSAPTQSHTRSSCWTAIPCCAGF